MKKISILGSTGSIGTQALNIIENNSDKYQVEVLTCRSRRELLADQIRKFKPAVAVAGNAEDAALLAQEFPNTEVLWGEQGLAEVARIPADIVLNSLLGISGLVPTYEAIKAGNHIALANKETLVTGGAVVMDAARSKGIRILPVDSEHSAIFQCLQGNEGRDINRLLLTASGGPFRGFSQEQLEKVTLEQALNHPSWSMGRKITVDSATMMNKGFEIIEAKWLFDVDGKDIQVLVHPQSIVHSMVEFTDKSIIAQLGMPDMRVPISFAFEYPDRLPNDYESLDFFSKAAELNFEKPDLNTFKCMKLAYECLDAGDTYATALNGANEILVELFLNGKIHFTDIPNTLEQVVERHKPVINPSLEDIIDTDSKVRKATIELLKKRI